MTVYKWDRERPGHQDTACWPTPGRAAVCHTDLSLSVSCFFFSSGVFSFAVMSATISPVSTFFSPYFSSSWRSRLHSQFSSGDKCLSEFLSFFLLEFMHLVFTRLPAESYRRRFRALLLYGTSLERWWSPVVCRFWICIVTYCGMGTAVPLAISVAFISNSSRSCSRMC